MSLTPCINPPIRVPTTLPSGQLLNAPGKYNPGRALSTLNTVIRLVPSSQGPGRVPYCSPPVSYRPALTSHFRRAAGPAAVAGHMAMLAPDRLAAVMHDGATAPPSLVPACKHTHTPHTWRSHCTSAPQPDAFMEHQTMGNALVLSAVALSRSCTCAPVINPESQVTRVTCPSQTLASSINHVTCSCTHPNHADGR